MILEDIPKRNAKRYPDKTALVFGNTRYTFKELNDRVNSLANAMSDMGLKKGDRFAIIADNCNQYVELYWVAIKTGIVMATLNPWFPQPELARIISDMEAKIIVFSQNYRDLVGSLRSQVSGVQEYIAIGDLLDGARSYEELISSYPPIEPEIEHDDDDVACLGSTGGTTGIPKQVMHTYRSMLVTMMDDRHTCALEPKDVGLFVGPFFWALAMPRIVNSTSYAACSLIILQDFTPQSILQAIEKEGASALLTGTQFIYDLVNYPDLGQYNYSGLRHVLGSGVPLPKEFWHQAVNTFGNIFTLVYGLCEFPVITLLCPEEFVLEGSEKEMNRLRSCGREGANSEARVVDEQGNDVKPGQMGEVIAKSPSMMKGYLNAPKLTNETIKGGYLYTGDLATVDEDGYIYLSGRKKDLITVQDKMLTPTEVEDIIYMHPQVSEAVAIGVPDEALGEVVKAVIVLKKGGKASESEIIELCQQRLPDYAVPRSVDFVETLPRSSVGKVLRRELRDKYTATQSA